MQLTWNQIATHSIWFDQDFHSLKWQVKGSNWMNCRPKNNHDMSEETKNTIHRASRQNNHNFKSNMRYCWPLVEKPNTGGWLPQAICEWDSSSKWKQTRETRIYKTNVAKNQQESIVFLTGWQMNSEKGEPSNKVRKEGKGKRLGWKTAKALVCFIFNLQTESHMLTKFSSRRVLIGRTSRRRLLHAFGLSRKMLHCRIGAWNTVVHYTNAAQQKPTHRTVFLH